MVDVINSKMYERVNLEGVVRHIGYTGFKNNVYYFSDLGYWVAPYGVVVRVVKDRVFLYSDLDGDFKGKRISCSGKKVKLDAMIYALRHLNPLGFFSMVPVDDYLAKLTPGFIEEEVEGGTSVYAYNPELGAERYTLIGTSQWEHVLRKLRAQATVRTETYVYNFLRRHDIKLEQLSVFSKTNPLLTVSSEEGNV